MTMNNKAVFQYAKGSASYKALTCPADVILFHGTRGSSKTATQLMSFIRYVGIGYGAFWKGILIDKEYKDFADVISQSKKFFKVFSPKAKFLESASQLKWVFPTGEELLFRHMKKEADYDSIHGHEYCLEENQEIITVNGNVKIKDLKPGDKVLTHSGFKRVNKVYNVGLKPCVKASIYTLDGRLHSVQLQSEDHRLLTSEGDWLKAQFGLYHKVPLHTNNDGFIGFQFEHPYTGEPLKSNLQLSHGYVKYEPCGQLPCYDIEVEDANHYLTCNGLSNKNCWIGFNELTKQATPALFDKVFSTNRSSFIPALHTPRNKDGEYLTFNKQPLPPIPLISFNTTNPNGPGHCVPFGEVLTNKGWVDIKEIKKGDSVFSIKPNGEMYLTECSDTVKEYYSGDMIKRDGAGTYLEFTENHRLPHLSTDKKSFTIKPFYELPNQAFIKRTCDSWVGDSDWCVEPERVVLYRKYTEVLKLNANDYAELLGWFLSEGCVVDRKGEHAFCIAQTKKHQVVKIDALLKRLNFNYRYDGKSFWINEASWKAHFSMFGKCRDKFIPDFVKNSNKETLSILLQSLMDGDGCENTYYTTSKQLADDVAEICVKLGHSVYVSSRQRKNRVGLSYEVRFSNKHTLVLNTGNGVYKSKNSNKSANVERHHYEGYVYCITVPETESFFIRQNGCVWISGNTWVKKRFINAGRNNELVEIKTTVFNPKTQQEEEVVKRQVAIFGSYKQNPFLDIKYIAELDRLTSTNKNLRKAWLEGSWDITSGGAFDDIWNSEIHRIPKFKIPKEWRVDRCFDWGSSHPFYVGWFAEANGEEAEIEYCGQIYKFCPPKGTLILFEELYGTEEIGTNIGVRWSAKRIAEEILAVESKLKSSGTVKGRIYAGPADNQIFDTRESDTDTIAKKMSDAGVEWVRSDKSPGSRKNGLELFRTRLEASVLKEGEGFYIMETCKAAIEILPTLPRDEKNPEDVDTKTEDHCWDVIRYRTLKSSNRIAEKLNINL